MLWSAISRVPQRLAILGILTVFAGFPVVSPAADRAEATADYLEWESSLRAHFDAHPELRDQKGSGWKPYNRHKWFTEQRMENGLLPPVGARWEAWLERKDRAQELGRATDTWFSLGPANLAGRMLSMAFDPANVATVYGGSAGGGLWKSTDSGATWVPLTDALPSLAVGGVAVSPNDSNIVVIATGEGTFNSDRIGGVGILRSTDAGATWQTTDLTYTVASGHGFHFLKANPLNGTMLAGATDGLYRSTDDGATWAQMSGVGNWFDAQWKPGDANRVYLARGSCGCNGANVKVSMDDGQTWTNAGGGASGFGVGKTKLAVTAADPSRLYAIYSDTSGSMLGFWRTTDDGATWTEMATSPNIPNGQGWYNLSLTADPNDADRVVAGGVFLWRSTDGGANWGTIGGNVHVDHHVAEYEPGSNSNLWAGSDGGFWRSTDDGSTWTGRNSGLVTYQFYDICVNRNGASAYYVMGGTQDNGTDKYDGMSTNWGQGLGGDGMVCNINELTGKKVYAETQFGGHARNTNFGVGNWSSITTGLTGSSRWVAPVALDSQDGTRLFTETSAGIFRTSSSGNNWTQVSTHRAVWIDISRIDGSVVWTTDSTPRYSSDNGNTWIQTSSFGFSVGGATKIHADPAIVSGAFVTFSGYSASAKVAHTTNWGATWSDVTGDLPAQPVNAIAVDPDSPGDWYIGTDTGVWKSTNGGVNWLPLGDSSFPNTVVDDLEIAHLNRKLVAGTHGRGAWELDIPLVGTGVSISEASQATRNLMLDSPWPNPVSDRVTFRFAARSQGPVSLDVYDVRGRLVASIAELATGDGIIRTTPWYPDHRANGVYFAVLRAGTEQISRKIVVTR